MMAPTPFLGVCELVTWWVSFESNHGRLLRRGVLGPCSQPLKRRRLAGEERSGSLTVLGSYRTLPGARLWAC